MDRDLKGYIILCVVFGVIFYSFIGIIAITATPQSTQDTRQGFTASVQKETDGLLFNLTLQTYRHWLGGSHAKANISLALSLDNNKSVIVRVERATLLVKYVVEDLAEQYDAAVYKDISAGSVAVVPFEVFVKGKPLATRIVELTQRVEVFIISHETESLRILEFSCSLPIEAAIYIPSIIQSFVGVDINGSLTVNSTVFLIVLLLLGIAETFGALLWNRYKAKAYAQEFRKQYENELIETQLCPKESKDHSN